jgi:hypothetical protein
MLVTKHKPMSVSTASFGPAGDLMSYRTVLHAEPIGNSTRVRVTKEIEIEKQLSKMLHGSAKSRLAATTQDAVEEQLVSLQQFATDHAKKQ